MDFDYLLFNGVCYCVQVARTASAQRAQSQTPPPSQGLASPSPLSRPATPKALAPPSTGGDAAGEDSSCFSVSISKAYPCFKPKQCKYHTRPYCHFCVAEWLRAPSLTSLIETCH